jgi:hypothetical protein
MKDEITFEMTEETPILLNGNTVMTVRLFHSQGTTLKSYWLDEWIDATKEADKAAGLLLASIENWCNALFLIALKHQITEYLKAHDAEYGSTWNIVE